jgi:hypothetical protein
MDAVMTEAEPSPTTDTINDGVGDDPGIVVQHQDEITWNKFLPYAHALDSESASFLMKIKKNLAEAILAHEFRPGMSLWLGHLNK